MHRTVERTRDVEFERAQALREFAWREYSKARDEAEYWRVMAHHWFLRAQAVDDDPIGGLVAHLLLSEIHRRAVPDLTEEDAPWLKLL